ncbi:TPA: proliferating cell nuclear antigen (pcna) [Candidatus Woesearchaeota archaeon]|nr:proliferating cell nuclear antigen (pcna) [Candidatus Woesearchaeota archaeon]HIH31317.1 proliferating cell nuclear antigen (pcna) [Candidatus Woesearchaeota archaeon]HIH55392.1 proliferating cell nuclear antigen (pcna) [Candidatus Woesearchaeota archaeon]HIJ01584.1 proliferating cell nuclear antigen (pcna) [Candidatus Woesearchaeota archaeon]HIJ14583.1 proliferating cell nuclear antigen (pcna) [Candidatus Woesearchaeota archaeon]
MKLVLAETKLIKEPITIINDLVNEAKFKVKKDSIEMIAMDPANVAMVVFRLLSSSFVEYTVKEDTVISLNLNNLKQVLRRIKANDNLVLELAENKLKITLQGNTVRTFYLPLIDLEEKEQKVPELKFKTVIKCPSGMLNDAIEDVEIIAESVSFQAEEKKFIVSASGDSSKATVEIKPEENVSIKAEEKVKSKYSIEYLKKMIQGSKIASTVEISFNKDYPLKLEYKELDKIQMMFILAPRIEND